MKVVAIIQGRLNSSRFPMKILASLGNKPIVSHVLERVSRIVGVDDVVLAIPLSDYPVIGHLWKNVSCGPEHDVLARYVKAAKEYGASIVLRVTCDCPLLPTDWASAVVASFEGMMKLPVYFGGCQPIHQVCDGFDVEIFTMEALLDANERAAQEEREHVTTYMRRHHFRYECDALPWPDLNGPFKLSVDTEADLHFVTQVYRKVGDNAGAYAILQAAREVASDRIQTLPNIH